jgi:hypothetical protein
MSNQAILQKLQLKIWIVKKKYEKSYLCTIDIDLYVQL